MVDVLFTHSYFLRFDPKEFRAMMPYPPLGTLYAASYARLRGYSVALFDSMLATHEEEILPAIEVHRPKVVVIYDDDFNYLTKMCLSRMREAAFRLAALAKKQGCTVIVHGSDPVDHVDSYLGHNSDYVVIGEGEQTLAETLDCILKKGQRREIIRGLAFKTGDAVHRAPPRDVLRDLDSLPTPAWDLVDIDRYRLLWKKRHGYFSLNLVTTRGCPFHCNWCAKPIYGQVYNSRSPANVAREMKFLKSTAQPDHIWFCDDIFGLKPGWVAEFSKEVISQKAVIPFKCLCRVDLLLKGDVIADLRRAGCTTVWVGAESGSQKILDAMEKGTTVEQISEAAMRLQKAGIHVGFFLQYGYPGETLDDIRRTLKMVKDCRPDEIGISVSYPLPGTKFYETVRQKLGEKHNWVDSQDLAMMFAGTYVADFYRTLHKVTHKKFRIWQGMSILKKTIMRPWLWDSKKLRRVAAGAFHLSTLPRYALKLDALARK